MPVNKTTISNLRHFGGTYAVIPSSTINMIKNPDSLAMLVWLLDRSEDWIVRREHLRTRFSLGRGRYDNAMRELKDLGLAWWHEERDPDTGRIIDRVLNVGDVPLESVLPKVGLSTIGETPAAGQSDHLPNTDTLPITDTTTTTKEKRFIAPTLEEVKSQIKLKGFVVEADYFFDFYTTAEWKDAGGKPVKNWKLKLLTWNKREKQNEKTKPHHAVGRKLSGAERTRIAREAARERERNQ